MPRDRPLSWVALFCLTDTRAKSRFKFTTDLTHGGSRSPHPRYGRLKSRVTAYAARATVLLSFIFKFGHFDAIIRRATLIMPQDPCRSHCGPMRYVLLYPILMRLSRLEKKFHSKIGAARLFKACFVALE